MAVIHRRQVKNALLRARVPLKGPIVAATWRAYELYASRRVGDDDPATVNGLALPPARLRVLVAGRAQPAWFLDTGRAHTAFLRTMLADAGRPIENMERILDFGCGCGRMLRWWSEIPSTTVHGCDYNRELVRWCERNLGFADVRANELTPPLAYERCQFDLLYALSIFTHLTTDLAERWLTEMHRVLKPGGLLWFTVHGKSLTDRLSNLEQAQFAAGEIVVHFPEVEGMNLCSTFWPEAAVRRMLADRFEVLVHFDPLADPATAEQAQMSHDAYLVRRRQNAAA